MKAAVEIVVAYLPGTRQQVAVAVALYVATELRLRNRQPSIQSIIGATRESFGKWSSIIS
jgi:hypothetical protein